MSSADFVRSTSLSQIPARTTLDGLSLVRREIAHLKTTKCPSTSVSERYRTTTACLDIRRMLDTLNARVVMMSTVSERFYLVCKGSIYVTLQRVSSFDHEHNSNREVISVARSLECKCERLSAAISMQVLVTGVQVQQISIRFVTSSQCCELTSQNPLRWYTAKAGSRQ